MGFSIKAIGSAAYRPLLFLISLASFVIGIAIFVNVKGTKDDILSLKSRVKVIENKLGITYHSPTNTFGGEAYVFSE